LLPAGNEQLSVSGCHCSVVESVGKTIRDTPETLVQTPKPPVSMLKLSKKHVLVFPSLTKYITADTELVPPSFTRVSGQEMDIPLLLELVAPKSEYDSDTPAELELQDCPA